MSVPCCAMKKSGSVRPPSARCCCCCCCWAWAAAAGARIPLPRGLVHRGELARPVVVGVELRDNRPPAAALAAAGLQHGPGK
eukprot:13987302-Alexandrium_andersonii.AAC.1